MWCQQDQVSSARVKNVAVQKTALCLSYKPSPALFTNMNVVEIYFNNTILDIKFVQLKSASQTGILHREIKDLNNTPLQMKKKKNQRNIFHIKKKKKL